MFVTKNSAAAMASTAMTAIMIISGVLLFLVLTGGCVGGV